MCRFDESDLDPELARSASESEQRNVISKLSMLQRSMISEEEFNYNLLIRLVDSHSECWGDMLNVLPPETMCNFGDYAQLQLESTDFMFSPGTFVVDKNDMELLEAVKTELRPRYLKLLKLIRSRVDTINMKR